MCALGNTHLTCCGLTLHTYLYLRKLVLHFAKVCSYSGCAEFETEQLTCPTEPAVANSHLNFLPVCYFECLVTGHLLENQRPLHQAVHDTYMHLHADKGDMFGEVC